MKTLAGLILVTGLMASAESAHASPKLPLGKVALSIVTGLLGGLAEAHGKQMYERYASPRYSWQPYEPPRSPRMEPSSDVRRLPSTWQILPPEEKPPVVRRHATSSHNVPADWEIR